MLGNSRGCNEDREVEKRKEPDIFFDKVTDLFVRRLRGEAAPARGGSFERVLEEAK